MNEIKCCRITYLADASDIKTLMWANHFAERCWKVEIISHKPPHPNFELNENIKIRSFFFSPNYPMSYLAFIELMPTLIFNRPDVIHARNFASYGVIAALFRRLLRFKPLVVTATGKDILKDSKTHKGWSIKHTAALADLITCSNEGVANELAKMNVSRNKIFVLENFDEYETSEIERVLIKTIEKS